MAKLNKKLSKLKTLANIQNLEIFREKLESIDFQENSDQYYKTIQLDPSQKIHTFSQFLNKKTEKIDLSQIQSRIKSNNLEGYLISTSLLGEVLQKHPLPVSAQKQNIIEHLARMNSGPYNQAEGIHLIYAHNHELDPILNPQINTLLAPNLSSQLISTLHRHKKSQLTIGEAQSSSPNKVAQGEALLQISHLSYHALDIDLSLEVNNDSFGSRQKLSKQPSVFESCINLPYSIRNRHFSDHGYILHLKGKQISPEKIVNIIGLEKTGFGGTLIASGLISSSVLRANPQKSLDLSKHKLFQQYLSKEEELIGSFTYDPKLELTKKGYCNLEKLGHLKSLQGEITFVFFPFFQSFIGEYKK